jgi:hypothetical protein
MILVELYLLSVARDISISKYFCNNQNGFRGRKEKLFLLNTRVEKTLNYLRYLSRSHLLTNIPNITNALKI